MIPLDFVFRRSHIPRSAYLCQSILVATLFFAADISVADVESAANPVVLFPEARAIGPAITGGRIMAITGNPEDPNMLLVGGATSGLWKSSDGGLHWQPISDQLDTSSIGAVAIAPTDRNTIWLGTGEPKPRYGTGFGTGVYRSSDGGVSWESLGLKDSERIQEIIIDPTDPNTAFVAVIGAAWNDSETRGVFKTSDGGKSWRRVLFTNASSGAASLVMDPRNPNKLIAAMWEFRREPSFFTSGGQGSGLFVSTDSGESWSALSSDSGLPEGLLGRIGIAMAPSNPDRVYALVEAERSGLYRSDDGGFTWSLASSDSTQFTILSRPWYFQKMVVDPLDEETIYHLHGALHTSTDGGKTFRTLDVGKNVHGDHHALWIDPSRPKQLWLGTDGGVYESRDRGGSWRFVDNLPFAQMYNVNIDMNQPYNIYTSVQDHKNWRGPSATRSHTGIRNGDWIPVAGQESGEVLPVPDDSRYVYGVANMGPLYVTDTVSGMWDEITPMAPDINTALRRNNAVALALNPFDKNGLYYGSQFVHRTKDRGKSWEIISPDLTSNNPNKQRYWNSGGLTWENFGGVTHTTIVEIAPSPVDGDVVWVGTDDGNIQITTDGGQQWRRVSSQLDNVITPGYWVSDISPSSTSAAAAYAVVNDFRRGDRNAYLFYTSDYGSSWTRVNTSSVRGPLHAVRQHPESEGLLFLGGEFGLYVSLDAGSHWHLYNKGIPTVAVRGMAIHPLENDLVIATFGRGAYIVDDIDPLRVLTDAPEVGAKRLHMFEIPAVLQYWRNPKLMAFRNGRPFEGEDEPYGALITFIAEPEMAGESAQLTVTDNAGAALITLDATVTAGINRMVWNLRPGKLTSVPSYYSGWPPTSYAMPEVSPGVYTATLAVANVQLTQEITIAADERLGLSEADRKANSEAVAWLVNSIDEMRTRYDSIELAVAELDQRDAEFAELPNYQEVELARQLVVDELSALSRRIHFQFEQRTVNVEPYAETMRREWPGGVLDYISRRVWPQLSSSWNRPSENDLVVLRHAESRLKIVAADLNTVISNECKSLNNLLIVAGLTPVELPERLVIYDFDLN